MADFLNEQEQVDVIKGWWKKNGKSTIAGIVIAVAVISGWHFWKHRNAQITNAASISFQVLLKANKDNNTSGVVAQAGLIKKEYAKTPYAVLAALFLAKEAVAANNNDNALTNLMWAKSHASKEMSPLVNLRLARVYLDLKQYSNALVLVDKAPKGFGASYGLVKGEVLQAQGKTAQARLTYTQASQSDIKDPGLLALIQMKLNSLPA